MNTLEQTIYTYLTQDMHCDRWGSDINAKRLAEEIERQLIVDELKEETGILRNARKKINGEEFDQIVIGIREKLDNFTTYHVGGRQYVSRDDVIRLIKKDLLLREISYALLSYGEKQRKQGLEDAMAKESVLVEEAKREERQKIRLIQDEYSDTDFGQMDYEEFGIQVVDYLDSLEKGK